MKESFRPAFSYNFLTPIYDLLTNVSGFGKSLVKRIIDLSDIKAGDLVLDVGSGTGTFLIEAKKRFPEAEFFGVDPDNRVLAIARKKLKTEGVKAHLICGYVQKLPFDNSTFHFVVSTLTFHHLKAEAKEKAAKEVFRILKTRGRFLLVDFGKVAGPISNVLLNLGSIFDGGEEMRANIRGVLPSLLENAGFQVKKVGNRYHGIEFLLGEK